MPERVAAIQRSRRPDRRPIGPAHYYPAQNHGPIGAPLDPRQGNSRLRLLTASRHRNPRVAQPPGPTMVRRLLHFAETEDKRSCLR